MATTELTSENFTSTIKDNEIVIIDFWATWCGPCQRFGPIFSKVSENHDDVVFGKLDVDAEGAISQSLGIQSVPTVMAFRKGDLVFNQPGVLNAAQLESLITQIKEMPVA